MANENFPYSTRILMGVVQGKEFKTPTYLRDTFFNTTVLSKAKFVSFDLLPNGDHGMAPFVNRRVGGKRIELQGFSNKMYEPPVVGNYFTVTPEDGFMRAPGRTEYDLAGPKSYLQEQIARGLRRIENKISRREEWMCAQALINGHIEVSGDGVSDDILFWSQLPENEQPKTTLATLWTANGVTALNVIEDLNEIVDKVVMSSGLTPTKIICGKNVINALRKILGESKLLDSRNVDMGSIAPQALPNGVRRLGYLADPGLEIYSYIARYEDEESGTIHPMIPDDKILFVSPEIDTIMAYGGIAIGWKDDGEPDIKPGTRFSFERPHDSLEQGRSIFLQSAPLPIVQSTNGFHVLKAV